MHERFAKGSPEDGVKDNYEEKEKMFQMKDEHLLHNDRGRAKRAPDYRQDRRDVGISCTVDRTVVETADWLASKAVGRHMSRERPFPPPHLSVWNAALDFPDVVSNIVRCS